MIRQPANAERSELPRQFLRFALVGTVGFAVDAGVLIFAMRVLGLGPYAARLLSFLVAATATWWLNRTFTFGAPKVRSLAGEWLRFLSVNAVGGALNIAVYSLLVATVPLVARWPVLGVGAGAVAGLGFNFVGSRRAVFRHGAASIRP
jgi:putative flippase GtrA